MALHARDSRPRDNSSARDGAGNTITKHEELVSAFVAATRSGDLDALMSMLADEARLVTDGGGKVQAALNVIQGAKNIARLIAGAAGKGVPEGTTVRFLPVNGLPGLIAYLPDGSVQTAALRSMTIASARFTACAIRTNSNTWRPRDRWQRLPWISDSRG